MGDQLTNQLNSYDFLFSSKSQTPPAANSKDYIGNFNHSPDCLDNACDDAISWSVCPAFVWFIFLASMFVSYCLVISLVTFSSVRCTLDRYKRHQEFYLFIFLFYLFRIYITNISISPFSKRTFWVHGCSMVSGGGDLRGSGAFLFLIVCHPKQFWVV